VQARDALPAAQAAADKAAARCAPRKSSSTPPSRPRACTRRASRTPLRLLSQIEARKNRLKQENMALVFPEPAKLAALEAQRAELSARVAGSSDQGEAEARLPALEEQRRTPTPRCRKPRASSPGWKPRSRRCRRSRRASTPIRS
jgi:hypothetical protein